MKHCDQKGKKKQSKSERQFEKLETEWREG